MGALVNNKFFFKKGMYIFAGVFSVLGVIFNSVAMGTNYWIVSEGIQNSTDPDLTVLSVNYGLFNGHKSLKEESDLSPVHYSLTVYCPSGEGICLVSCGTTDEDKRAEFDYLRFGEKPYTCKLNKALRSSRSHLLQLANKIPVEYTERSEPIRGNDPFMNYGLWVTTIIFLSFMLAFQIISAGLCFFNTATVPIETLVGPMGIYLSNGVVVLTGLITLSLWGDLYSSDLSSELAIQETILDKYIMNSTNLGFSYWFVLWTLILAIATIVCIRFRNSLKKFGNHDIGVESSTPGGMLY